MVNFELRQQRLLSGKGTIRLDQETREKSRTIILTSKVVRQPKNAYMNKKLLPPKSFYGYLTFSRNDIVTQVEAIEYPLQAWVFNVCNDGEIMRQIACINQEILQSIANLGSALGLTPISIENETKEWQHIEYFWDCCQLVAYSSAAVLLEAHSVYLDICEEIGDVPPPPPPPPSPNADFPEVPEDEPLDIDDPYEDDTEDTHNPDELDDSYIPPPDTEPCVAYTLSVSYDIVNAIGQPAGRRTTDAVVWGIISDVRVTSGNFEAFCQGLTTSGCNPTQSWVLIFTDPAVAPTPNLSYTKTLV